MTLMEPKDTKNLRFDFTTDDIDFHTSEEEFEEEEFVEEEEEYEYEDEEYDSEAEDLVSERKFDLSLETEHFWFSDLVEVFNFLHE